MISGGARAVHHIESPAMTSLCRQCNVRDIDTLIAIVSVIRRYQRSAQINVVHPPLYPPSERGDVAELTGMKLTEAFEYCGIAI
jgi:hypothetical protein